MEGPGTLELLTSESLLGDSERLESEYLYMLQSHGWQQRKREAILEGSQVVRVPGGAVLGAELALWNRRQREATPEIEMRRTRGSGSPGSKGRR